MYAITFSLMLVLIGCGQTDDREVAEKGRLEAPPTSREVIRIATSGDYAPFSIWEKGAEPRGFSAAIAEAFAAETGASIAWVRFKWPELEADLEADRFDFALSGITVRPERSIVGRFSIPLTTSGAMVLVPAESSIGSAAELDRDGASIAVNAGGHLERVTRRLFPNARIEAVPNNAGVLERLARTGAGAGAGAVDAVVTDDLEAPLWIDESERPLRAIGPLTRDMKAALFPPTRASLAREFDDWLLRAEADGRLAAMRERFDLPPNRTARPGAALLTSLEERLALMPAVGDAKAVLSVPVENLPREKVVLDAAVRSVDKSAAAMGIETLDRDAVRAFYQAQIEAAKTIQTERIRRAAGVTKPTPSAGERNVVGLRLDRSIRPALLYLGDRIGRLIVAVSRDAAPAPTLAEVEDALGSLDLPTSQIRSIHQALDALVSPE